jgi:HEAT repeats
MSFFRLSISTPLFATLLAMAAIAVISCGENLPGSEEKKNQPRGLVLKGIHWRHSGTSAETLDKTWFAKTVREVMVRQSQINQTDCVLQIEGGLETTGGEGTLVIEARVSLEKDKMVLHSGVSATGEATDPAKAEQLVRKGLEDVGDSIADQLVLLKGNRQRWVQGLEASEPDVQVLALRLIGRGRIKQAVPAVARLLEDPREQVAEVAAETLMLIGDQRAVPLLIASVRRGDLRSEVRAIEAMAKIGGDEAQAYLEMIALGHEIQEVRNLATELLKQQNSE